MAPSTPDWETLDGTIAGAVTLPGAAGYDRGRLGFNARYHDLLPAAIVSCAAAEDVAETIDFAARYGLEHATRSGGHCFAGHSSTGGGAHRQSWATVHLWGSGRVFQNFADPGLEGWPDAYYGTNYNRLVGIKARYDPANFFRFPQSLPVR